MDFALDYSFGCNREKVDVMKLSEKASLERIDRIWLTELKSHGDSGEVVFKALSKMVHRLTKKSD